MAPSGFLPVSLYLCAFVSMSSFSKSLRSDLKIFLGVSPVLSVSSWRVNSLPSALRAFITCSSVLLSFTLITALCCFSVFMAQKAFSILRSNA